MGLLKQERGYLWLHCLLLDPFPLTGLSSIEDADVSGVTSICCAKASCYLWEDSSFLSRKGEGWMGRERGDKREGRGGDEEGEASIQM